MYNTLVLWFYVIVKKDMKENIFCRVFDHAVLYSEIG